MSEIIASPEQDFISFDEVRVIRALAESLQRHARTQVDNDQMSGYVLYDSPRRPMGSNSVDVFMGVVSRRFSNDYHQFTVSFLSMMMNEELRYSNTRELYRYNWNNIGYCVGTKIVTDNYNPVVSTRYDTEKGYIDTVEPDVTSYWRPLDSADGQDLLARMQATGRAVTKRRRRDGYSKWSRGDKT